MSNVTTRPNAADMLLEVQNYRTSLESLMEVGRTLLEVPSMEENSAVAFTVLAENILEEAGHQDDLEVVDGVDEPAAKVELIMQDVLQPRILESERVETTLADKAENEVPDPFHTSHRMTESAAMESLKQMAEVLDLYSDNVALARTLVSMEGADLDLVRPAVMQTLNKFGDQLGTLGVSMEDVGKTQVLGELSDAVSRVEQLVEKAKESVEEKIGAQLDEDVKVNSIDSDDAAQADTVDGTDEEQDPTDESTDLDEPEPDEEETGLTEDTLMSDVEDPVEEDDGVAVEEEESEEEDSAGEDADADPLEVDGEDETEYTESEDDGEVELPEDDLPELDQGEEEEVEEEEEEEASDSDDVSEDDDALPEVEEEEGEASEEEEEVQYTESDDDDEPAVDLDEELPELDTDDSEEDDEATTYVTLDKSDDDLDE